MFGHFQKTALRIELETSAVKIRDSLLKPAQFRQWLLPQQFDPTLPDELTSGLSFQSHLGGVPITYYVDQMSENHLCLLLSEGVDGYREWKWGDGWVQSRFEGISLLPLSLGQTLNLVQLRNFLGKTVNG